MSCEVRKRTIRLAAFRRSQRRRSRFRAFSKLIGGEVAVIPTAHPVQHWDSASTVNLTTHFFKSGQHMYEITMVPHAAPTGDFASAAELCDAISAGSRRYHIPTSRPSYHHSLAASQHYAIIVESPLRFSMSSMAYSLLTGALITDMFPWDESAGSKFMLIDLATGQVAAEINGPPFFAFHFVNAYEQDDGTIILDCCAFDNSEFLAHMTVENLRSKDPDIEGGYIRRFELDPRARTCRDVYAPVEGKPIPSGTHHPVCCSVAVAPEAVELPRINDAYLGKKHRYMWAAELTREDGFRGIVKFDMDTRATSFWRDTQAAAGEPIFVPRDPHASDAASEDDGVLLAAVLDLVERRTYLLVLDARSLKELCRAYAPVHMPLSFHGTFIP